MSLLEQDIIRKKRLDKNVTKHEAAGNSKKK